MITYTSINLPRAVAALLELDFLASLTTHRVKLPGVAR